MQAYLKKSILLITILLVSACATIGNKIEQTALNKIKIGKTTQTEMIEIFGMPQGQLFVSDGKLNMVWQYISIGPFGAGMKQQNLAVLFDENKKVEKFNLLDDTLN